MGSTQSRLCIYCDNEKHKLFPTCRKCTVEDIINAYNRGNVNRYMYYNINYLRV